MRIKQAISPFEAATQLSLGDEGGPQVALRARDGSVTRPSRVVDGRAGRAVSTVLSAAAFVGQGVGCLKGELVLRVVKASVVCA